MKRRSNMPGLNGGGDSRSSALPYEGSSSNGYTSRQPPPNSSSSAYYYSRGGELSPATSSTSTAPAASATATAAAAAAGPPPNMNNNNTAGYRPNGVVYNGNDGRRRPVAAMQVEDETPSYWVEHLATFAVGKQFGLQWPSDGVRKLKQMEKNSAIWAQPMVLRLRPNVVSVEDENGELVEQFPMELVTEPTAHLSTDPRDVYNNIVLFVVREDRRAGHRPTTPTEMHIFQCNRVSANEVVDDMRAYLAGQFQRVRVGRRDTGFIVASPIAPSQQQFYSNNNSGGSARGGDSIVNAGIRGGGQQYRDDASASSDTSEYFERDVNTLNRCFDDIERFVARIQSAAIAQREIEAQQHRSKSGQRSRREQQQGILQLRAQLPGEYEFVDILQKFKLSFNLLAKLKNHIHEPNAPELLHFLFTPLTVILDACHWGLGRNIAPQIISPLLTRETKELMQNCLTSKESDVWMALGDAWRVPPEDWPSPLPPPYRPVFADGFMPYGPPQHEPSRHHQQRSAGATSRGGSRSVDNLNTDMDRMSLERERLEFEREKVLERERRLLEEERRIRAEKQRLEAERRMLIEEQERRSVISERQPANYYRDSTQNSPAPIRRTVSSQPVVMQHNGGGGGGGVIAPASMLGGDQSPRQKAFLDDLRQRRCKVVQATYDRVAQNPKELTVTRGEYLEVLNDSKNWWECRNIHSRVGYVPHTILSVVATRDDSPHSVPPQDPLFVAPGSSQQQQQQTSSSAYAQGNIMNTSSSSPRPAADTYEVSNAAVQANIYRNEVNDYPPSSGGHHPPHIDDYQQRNHYQQQQQQQQTAPPAAPPPAAPPVPPDLRQQLTTVRLKTTTRPQVVENGFDQHDHIEVVRRQAGLGGNNPPRKLVDEIQATITRSNQGLNKPTALNNEARVILSEHSTPDQVAEWLMEKGFSMRTMNVLEEQTGATLFALTKSKLQDFCGKEEGQRLYSQLLVQKNKTGYNTKSGAELRAILNLRKRQVEGRQQQQQQRPMSTLDEEMVNDLSAIDVVIDQDHHNQQQRQQQQQYQPSTSSPDHTVRVYN